MVELFKGIIDLQDITLYYNGGFLTMVEGSNVPGLDDSDEDDHIPPTWYQFRKITDPPKIKNWKEEDFKVTGWQLWVDKSDPIFDDGCDYHYLDQTIEGEFNFREYPPTDPDLWKKGKENKYELDTLSKIMDRMNNK